MIYFNLSKWDKVLPMVAAASAGVIDEGTLLVYADSGLGYAVVTPSTGAANEPFAGIAAHQRVQFSVMSGNKTVYDGAAAQNIEVKNFIAGTGIVKVDGVKDATLTTDFNADGKVTVPIQSGAAKKYTFVYSYTPTVLEVQNLIGETQDTPAQAVGMNVAIGVVSKGAIFITNFETQDDWTIGATVKTGANGRASLDGTGTAMGRVIALPTDNEPYLGIELA